MRVRVRVRVRACACGRVRVRVRVRVCVCVCGVAEYCTLSPQLRAGECGMTEGPHSTKLPQSWDTGSDQSGVPALRDSECPFGPLGCGAVCASCSFG